MRHCIFDVLRFNMLSLERSKMLVSYMGTYPTLIDLKTKERSLIEFVDAEEFDKWWLPSSTLL